MSRFPLVALKRQSPNLREASERIHKLLFKVVPHAQPCCSSVCLPVLQDIAGRQLRGSNCSSRHTGSPNCGVGAANVSETTECV